MKAQERIELERMEQLRDEIEKHPMTARIREEETAKNLVKRKAAREQIDRLQTELEGLPTFDQATNELTAESKICEERIKVLQEEINRKIMMLRRQKLDIEGEMRQAEIILLESADPAIDQGIQFFRDKIENLRKPGRISSRGMTVDVNLFTDIKTLTTEINRNAVLATICYCQGSVEKLQGMKLRPEFHIEEIEELKSKIPSIEIFEQVSGKKHAWPWINTDPRSLFKSDSQIDWELGKINEKFKRVMKR